MSALLFLLLPLAAAEPPKTLKARAVLWDVAYKPASQAAWIARLEEEVEGALKDGVDVLAFSELFAWGLAPYKPIGDPPGVHITRTWTKTVLPRLARRLKGREVLVVLGSYPHQEPGWRHAFNRAPVWHGGRWRFADKLDPTQQELLEDPPIRAGSVLPLFPFKGGLAAALICYSVEKPEVALALKKKGVNLLVVPSATPDEHGVGRILRTASARAVELGAAVLVAPLTGEIEGWPNTGSAALYLPEQKGVEAAVQEGERRSRGIHRQDFDIPWAWLLSLRTQKDPPEVRPFLAPTPAFTLREAR